MMTIIDRARMVPPAPQPRGLRRLGIASLIFLTLSSLSLVLIYSTRSISVAGVGWIPELWMMTSALTGLYVIKRRRLEKAYWIDERYSAHVFSEADRLRTEGRRGTVEGLCG